MKSNQGIGRNIRMPLLARYYNEVHFHIKVKDGMGTKDSIHIGTIETMPYARELVNGSLLDQPESYLVLQQAQRGFIIGSDAPAVIYGVYALLEKLGCGFYPSFNSVPNVKIPFSFDQWNLNNRPLSTETERPPLPGAAFGYAIAISVKLLWQCAGCDVSIVDFFRLTFVPEFPCLTIVW